MRLFCHSSLMSSDTSSPSCSSGNLNNNYIIPCYPKTTKRICRICLEEEEDLEENHNEQQQNQPNGNNSDGKSKGQELNTLHSISYYQNKSMQLIKEVIQGISSITNNLKWKGNKEWSEGEHYRKHLISPCLCKGSSEYVHESCLTKWRLMNFSREDRRDICTVCLTPYAIRHSFKGVLSRVIYFSAFRISALSLLIPLGSIASILLPLLPRRGNYEIVDGKIFVSSSHYGVDLTGLDVTPWSYSVFKPILSKKIIEDINSIILFPESGMRFALKGNFLPGIIWGCARLGSIGFYLSYFLNGSISEFINISYFVNFFPQYPGFQQGMTVFLNYVFFCATLRAIRTPMSPKGVGVFVISTLIGLFSVYQRLYMLVRGFMLHEFPSLAHLELGELASR